MKTRHLFSVLGIFLLLCALCACSIDSEKKPKTISYSLWPAYTFEEACDEAVKIVIGTVSSNGKTYLRRVSVHPLRDGKYAYSAFADYTFKVESTLKGEHTSPITYSQSGGETSDHIYISEDMEQAKKGDRFLIFLNENGFAISPSFRLLVDADGNVTSGFFPASCSAMFSASEPISVDEYAELITDYLAK